MQNDSDGGVAGTPCQSYDILLLCGERRTGQAGRRAEQTLTAAEKTTEVRRRRLRRRRYAWSPIHDPRLLNWVVIRAGHAPPMSRPVAPVNARRPAGDDRRWAALRAGLSTPATAHLSHGDDAERARCRPAASSVVLRLELPSALFYDQSFFRRIVLAKERTIVS